MVQDLHRNVWKPDKQAKDTKKRVSVVESKNDLAYDRYVLDQTFLNDEVSNDLMTWFYPFANPWYNKCKESQTTNREVNVRCVHVI